MFWSKLMGHDRCVYTAQTMLGLPIVIFRDKEASEDLETINHEKIHMYQALYLLYIPFWLMYIGHYLINLFKYNAYDSYRNIVFEKEAYDNDMNMDYLKTRKPYAWVKYFK